jgi:hypothetical protein
MHLTLHFLNLSHENLGYKILLTMSWLLQSEEEVELVTPLFIDQLLNSKKVSKE